jgi:hypothetical protein
VARFDRTIPPGGEGRITLEVRTKGYQGPVHKTAQVLTNDPRRQEFVIGLQGEVWVPILQLPRGVGLRGIAGDKIEATVQLVAQKPDPLTLEVSKIFPPEKIAVELKETEKGRAFELHIVNKVDGEERYAGQVILKTNYPEKPELSLSIGANIQGPIEVRPHILSFGKLNMQRLTQLVERGGSMKRPVMVILNKGDDLRIEKCETQDSVFRVVSTRAMTAGRMFEIQVEAVTNKLKTGMNKDILRIHTNQKDKPVLEVPIQFEVL